LIIVFAFSACSAMQPRMQFYVPIGHSEPVTSVDVSADGRYAVSASNDYSIKLWDLSTGREIRTLHTGSTLITSVSFSPDGRMLYSGHTDGTTRLWELSTGKIIRKLRLHRYYHAGGGPGYDKRGSGMIHAAGFSNDGKMAISSGRDGSINIVEVATGIEEIKYHTSKHPGALGSSISANGRYAILTSRKIEAWDLKNRKKIAEIDIHRNYTVMGITGAISSDGNTAVTSFRNGSIEIWDLKSLQLIRTVSLESNMVRSIVFSNNSKYFICIHYNGDVSLWTSIDGKKVREINLGSSKAFSGVFVPGDRRILLGTGDGSLEYYSLSSGAKIRTVRRNALETNSVALSPAGGVLATGTESGEVHLWNMAEGRNVRRFRGRSSPVTAVAFSRDGGLVISGQKNGFLNIWNKVSGNSVKRVRAHSGPVNGLALTPDQKMLLSGGNDMLLKLWDMASGKKITAFSGHKHWISDIAVTSDSKLALTASYDGTVRIWDLHQKKMIRKIDLGSGWVQCISISKDDQLAVAGCFRNVVLIDLQSGLITKQIQLHNGYVMAVALSPDGEYLYTAGEDYLIKQWHLRKQKLARIIKGHNNVVSSIAISSDGRKLVTCSRDLTTRIWDADSGEEIVRLLTSVDGEWIITTPDGYYDTSPEGTALVRWAFPGSQETFSFEQFESTFHRLDIIRQRLAGDLMAGQPIPGFTRPPIIHMPDHQSIKILDTHSYRLDLTVLSADTVKTVRVFNNGKALLEVPVNEKGKTLSLEIQLFSGANRITAVAHDVKGFSSNPKYVDVMCNAPDLSKPKLHVLAIGSSNYPRMSAQWQLSFAHTDARAVVDEFEKQNKNLFDDTKTYLLTNENATIASITNALSELSTISENDVAVIFMAGHGVRSKDGTFYFLTSEGTVNNPQEGGLSWSLFDEYLGNIKGRVIMLLDACHSGSIVNETVVPNDELAEEFFAGKRGGVMVFSASKGRQYSLESPDIGGGFGVFSYALTRGLGPNSREADVNENGIVEFMELVEYVSLYVDKATMGQQTPWLSRKELFGDLPIAIVQ